MTRTDTIPDLLFRSVIVAVMAVSIAFMGLFIAVAVLFFVAMFMWVLSLCLASGDTTDLVLYFATLALFKITCYAIVIVTTVYFVAEMYKHKNFARPTAHQIVKIVVESAVIIGLAEIVCIGLSVFVAMAATDDSAFVITCALYLGAGVTALVFGLVPALIMWFSRTPAADAVTDTEEDV